MKKLFERSWLEINLDNLRRNASIVFDIIDKECKMIPVVKANSYGLGADIIAKELESMGAYAFAVATLTEGVNLRKVGVRKPIIILGGTLGIYTEWLLKYDIIPTVSSLKSMKELNAYAKKFEGKLKLNISIDTGMGRLGFRANTDDDIERTINEIKYINKLSNVEIFGTFTHLSQADVYEGLPQQYTLKQFENFNKVTQGLQSLGVDVGIKHVCNSTAMVHYPQMHLDAVRPGVVLYGIDHSENPAKKLEFKRIVEFKSRIILVKKLLEGESVSYSATFTAPKDMKIAVVPVGYADGIPRSLSGKGYLLVHGKKANILGRICMDQLIVDVTHISNVMESDVAVIFGSQGKAVITPEEIAECAGTIPQEIFCNIGLRVPRVYIKKGAIYHIKDRLF